MKKKFSIKSLVLWLLIILWMIGIYTLSAEDGIISGGRSMKVAIIVQRLLKPLPTTLTDGMKELHLIELIIRKTGHIVEYFVLSFLVLAVLDRGRRNKIIAYICAFLIPITYAVLDEFHQVFTPWRDGQLSDVMIDSIGVVFGMFAYNIVCKIVKNKAKSKQELSS